MNRRTLLAAGASAVGGSLLAQEKSEPVASLKEPANGRIDVAVLISEGATVIDFCGPWEVFQDVMIGNMSDPHHKMPFNLFTVAQTKDPIRCSGGLRVVPDHTFETAPTPHIIVIPAQRGRSQPILDWLRKAHETAHLTMSVCTGAFLLAESGLLKGKAATTHHDFYNSFAKRFPDVQLQRGLRYVEHGKIATAGGLSSGIDLALHVVERYYGRKIAQQTADYMEYQGKGWLSA